ncbi:MAG: RsmD family RNA methyltransferase [Prevotella sp.]|jgi:16S rRNA G966 N2-methylase RsmD|nr:RsmD family RNA methyltransferase [Prevotella sp.]
MLDNALLEFVGRHENDELTTLALQADRYPAINMPLAIRQIAGRQIACRKLSAWYANNGVVYPPHLALEQCSSELTARYKADIAKTNRLVDLTGGLGVDCYFMSLRANECVYVEQQAELAEIAAHNFKVLGANNIRVFNGDALSFLKNMPAADTIYIDPSRRDRHGRKTVLLNDCTPNLLEIEDLLEEKGRQIIIKLSPMLDISMSMKMLRNIVEVHIISCHNECKELLLVKTREKSAAHPLLHCINLQESGQQQFSFTREEEASALPFYTAVIGNYLYEPNASILKAGAYKCLAAKLNLSKLHPSSHLYTSDKPIADFQGRTFAVCEVFDFNKKNINRLAEINSKANIAARNFPLSVVDIRKRTGVKDGGELYIFATTLTDERKVLILCRKRQ